MTYRHLVGIVARNMVLGDYPEEARACREATTLDECEAAARAAAWAAARTEAWSVVMAARAARTSAEWVKRAVRRRAEWAAWMAVERVAEAVRATARDAVLRESVAVALDAYRAESPK